MLKFPDMFNALDSTVASEMQQNYDIYLKKAVNHAKKHANKPIDELMESIMGEKTEDNKETYENQNKEIEEWILKYKQST